ncbi:acyl-CoA thioester hydrolase [Arthrobacter ginsengisoli]|uniref:Acyl-CoA thioester hydrolase n=1 Tax=Arthrobacter ginsengisoli TaxID=1356565 RepID=A0ABU1UE12_9MICC|nr:acyl-CoA thioesterase [Arthrobacter ginsengisoli]MDR7083350.1 acyl-CoA thioester hydrolase [Arthrobacter ginsengisoli]
MKPVHTRKHHVALGDVDSALVIYFAAVFRWHEQSFSEWLAQRYMPLSRILASGRGLPIVNCSASYAASIRQDDIVTLDSWVSNAGRSSFTFGTTVLSGGTVAATVETRHVWVEASPSGAFKSANLPEALRVAAGELAGSEQPSEGAPRMPARTERR